MSVIVEFTVEQDAFALGAAMAAASGMRIELDRILPDSNPGVPYLWASGGDFEAFEALVAESDLVHRIKRVDQSGDTALYRIEWEGRTESLIQELIREEVSILEGSRRGIQWYFRLRFDDHENLTAFNDYCASQGIEYDLERLYSGLDQDSSRSAFELTNAQADTLALAVERGYYQVPRGVTLEELGAELGISPQATSERLRRATDRVLRTVLFGRSTGATTGPGAGTPEP